MNEGESAMKKYNLLFVLMILMCFMNVSSLAELFQVHNTGNVNIRSEPNSNSTKVGTGIANKTYTILDEEQGWYQIQMEDGKTGWISGKLGSVLSKAGNADNNTSIENSKSKYDYAFIRPLSNYSVYMIFDEDAHVVKYYTSDDHSILSGKYTGSVNTEAKITYKDGGVEWTEKFQKNGKTGILIDDDGFDWAFQEASVEAAEAVLKIHEEYQKNNR